MTDSKNKSGGFLKGQFENCPKCSELMTAESPGCRHCGWLRSDEATLVAASSHYEPVRVRQPESPPLAQTGPGSVPLPEKYLTCYTIDGQAIPPEYPSKFNPDAFSWPAFFFTDLWHAEKGLVKEASRNFTIRIFTSVMFALSIMFSMASGNDPEMPNAFAVGLGVILFLIGLGGLIGCTIKGSTDAKVAHRRYIDFYNASIKSGGFEENQKAGLNLYWKIIYVPFGMFTAAFIMMLIIISIIEK